jgi:hypothetical protein
MMTRILYRYSKEKWNKLHNKEYDSKYSSQNITKIK